jgi:hypothetical protein
MQPTEDGAARILWMLATMFCFIALDAIIKHLMESFARVNTHSSRFEVERNEY